ncbi:MAG: DUF2975 domain-containing protein [Clostridia bacterium]|nr:DUF2975 domain-containing protein [Clostridia bacterium]
MKKLFSDVKVIFTLLMLISILAIVAGVYLGVALGMQVQASVTVLSAAGILLWTEAWGTFLVLCLRLRKGESAFTPATGKSLTIIGWCMVGLAAVSFAAALINGALGKGRDPLLLLVETVLLPGFFLAVGVVAKVLQGLLAHAMSIEKEQEGVV